MILLYLVSIIFSSLAFTVYQDGVVPPNATSGGALDGGGPTIANGVLYTNSGYGKIVGQPGHLLLAFTVDGK